MGDVFFEAKWPTARTEHECMQCERKIGKGEKYRRQGYIFDGQPGQTKVCRQCTAFADALYKIGFEGEEGMLPYLRELESSEVAHCGYSVELRLFWAKWREGDELVEFPARDAA